MHSPDLWLVHQDKVHFDLIVSKQSILCKEGAINTQDKRIGDNDYCCEKCEYVTKDEKSLVAHRKSVHDNQEYSCDGCEYKAAKKCELEAHKKSVHGESQYNCDECDYQETKKSKIEFHKKSVHGGIKYYCDECEYTTTENGGIKTHKSVHEARKFICDQCQYLATDETDLEKHVLSAHGDISGPGYMGWRIPDSEKKETTFETKLEELKVLYETLKSEFRELKADFEVANKKLQETSIENKKNKERNSNIEGGL